MNELATYVAVEGINIDDFMREHFPLVHRIARHLAARLPANVQLDDLTQAGMIGLIEASRHYDPGKGASFSTYAGIRIRGAMLDEIRKGDWTPRSVHRNSRRVAEAVRALENELGRDAKDNEVASYLKMSVDEYNTILQEGSCSHVAAFDDIGVDEESVIDGLGSRVLGPHEGIMHDSFLDELANYIASLPEKERLVITLYYEEELNLREIGEVLEVTESRVCQIHSQAVARLRTKLADWRE